MTEQFNSPMVPLEVSVTVTATVQVPADLVPDYLSKRLHRWPDELLEAVSEGWAEETGLSKELYRASDDVEVRDLRDSPYLDDPSTY